MIPKLLNKQIHIFIVAVSGALVVVALIFWIVTLQDMCGNHEVKELSSPDGKLKLVLFVRDCGATTSYSPQASILKTGESLANETGNIFVGDNNGLIDAEWIDDSHLKIYHNCDQRDLLLTMSHFKGVEIKYERKNSIQ